MAGVSREKWSYRSYRVRVAGEDGYFVGIRREPDGWHAVVRDSLGDLVCFAGIWKTLRDATAEGVAVLRRRGG